MSFRVWDLSCSAGLGVFLHCTIRCFPCSNTADSTHRLINKPFRRLKCVCQRRETLKSTLEQGQNCRTLLYVIVWGCYLLKWVLIRGFIFWFVVFFYTSLLICLAVYVFTDTLGIWFRNGFEVTSPVSAVLFM